MGRIQGWLKMVRILCWRLMWLGPSLGKGFKEESIPKDAGGNPDLSYFLEGPEYYFRMCQDYYSLLGNAKGLSAEHLKRAYSRRVYGTWGLIAKGQSSLPYVHKLFALTVPEAREDAAGIVTALIGSKEPPESMVRALIGALEAATNSQERDSLVLALGRTKSRTAIRYLSEVLQQKVVDSDTCWTIIHALEGISEQAFRECGDPCAAALSWAKSYLLQNNCEQDKRLQ